MNSNIQDTPPMGNDEQTNDSLISAIVPNLVTDVIKHLTDKYGKHLPGPMQQILKGTGFMRETFYDQLQVVLRDSLTAYLREHPYWMQNNMPSLFLTPVVTHYMVMTFDDGQLPTAEELNEVALAFVKTDAAIANLPYVQRFAPDYVAAFEQELQKQRSLQDIANQLFIRDTVDRSATRVIEEIRSEIQQTAGRASQQFCPEPPPMPEHFAGRDTIFQAMRTDLATDSDTTYAITAIKGLGGIGKTTLADALAHRLHADGAVCAVLKATVGIAGDTAVLLRQWVSSCTDAPFQPEGVTAGEIAAAARPIITDAIRKMCDPGDGRVLVLLDDVWDTRESRAAVTALKDAAPTNRVILITTRNGQLANTLADAVKSLDKLTPDEAVDVLRGYLNDTARQIPADDLRALATALDGHTLALTLAAKRAQDDHETLGEPLAAVIQGHTAEYNRELPRGTLFAQLELARGEEKEQNLTRALALSYDALAEHDQKHFREVGVLVYNKPFHRDLLAALWDVPPEGMTAALKPLVLRGLLEPAPATGPGWYSQHPLLNSYARALLQQTGETDAAFARYTDHVTAVVEQFRTLPPQDWGALDGDLPHIEHVGDALSERWDAAAAAPDDALRDRCLLFAYNTIRYISRRPQMVPGPDGPRLRGMNWLQTGLAAARAAGDSAREGPLVGELGNLWNHFGQKQKAIEHYELALELAEQLEDDSGKGFALGALGHVYDALGDKTTALDYYQQALTLRRQVGDKRGEATTLNNIGAVYSDLGDKTQALDHYQQALPLRRQVGDKRGEATTLSNIGMVHRSLGENDKALDYYQQALPLLRQVGDKGGEATTLTNMAAVYYSSGELDNALGTFQQVADVFRAIGAAAEEATVHSNIAVVLEQLGRIDEAVTHVEQAIALLKSKNLPRDAGGNTLADLERRLAGLRGAPPPHANPAMDAIRAFLNTSNWAEARAVYEANQAVLASPEVEQMFEQAIAGAPDEDNRRNLQAHLDRIRRAKSQGAAAAFAEDGPPEAGGHGDGEDGTTPPPSDGTPPLPSDGTPPPSNDNFQPNDEVKFRLYAPSLTEASTRNSLHLYAFVEQTVIQIQSDVQRFEEELGGSVPKPKEAKKVATVARETPITVIPESDELEFEPQSLTKKWYGDWTRYDFDFRPGKELIDETVFVRVSIQIGGIEIAHIKCAVEIVENRPSSGAVSSTSLAISDNPLAAQKFQSQTTTPYQRIFISYSRRDTPIARAYKLAQIALGNHAFLDVDDLRAGENWQAALAEAIDEADIFQLFWSEHSSNSKYCEYEWEYALQHRCPDNQCETFIRPVYWQEPMPKVPNSLRHLNFKYVPFEAGGDTGNDK